MPRFYRSKHSKHKPKGEHIPKVTQPEPIVDIEGDEQYNDFLPDGTPQLRRINPETGKPFRSDFSKTVSGVTRKDLVHAIRAWRGRCYLIAHHYGVTSGRVSCWIKEWDLQQEVDEAKGRLLDVAEDKLYEAMMRGEAWAIIFFLRTQGRVRGYIEKKEISVETPEQKIAPERFVDVDALPTALKRSLVEYIRQAKENNQPVTIDADTVNARIERAVADEIDPQQTEGDDNGTESE